VSGFRPTCPLCREVNPPEAVCCAYCGAALTMDEYERRQRASIFAARQHRQVTPQSYPQPVEITDLLDAPYDDDLESPSDAGRA
jgi:uncharacterized OB-fold protein